MVVGVSRELRSLRVLPPTDSAPLPSLAALKSVGFSPGVAHRSHHDLLAQNL